MAHHAQEERLLRNCHDLSNYTAGTCGAGGHLAQAVYGCREMENGTPWMWVQREMGEKKRCLAPIF
jgi:hypothetical protein